MSNFLTKLILLVPLLERLVKIGHEVQKEETVPGLHKCQIETAQEALGIIQETFKTFPSNAPNFDKMHPVVIRQEDLHKKPWQLTICPDGLYVRPQLKDTFSFDSWNKAKIKELVLSDGTVLSFPYSEVKNEN